MKTQMPQPSDDHSQYYRRQNIKLCQVLFCYFCKLAFLIFFSVFRFSSLIVCKWVSKLTNWLLQELADKNLLIERLLHEKAEESKERSSAFRKVEPKRLQNNCKITIITIFAPKDNLINRILKDGNNQLWIYIWTILK